LEANEDITGHSYFRKTACTPICNPQYERGESKVVYVAWRQVISNGKKFKMMSVIKARNPTNMAKKEQVTVVSTLGSVNKPAGAAPGSEINPIFHVITIDSPAATF
jgi:hypothetical protein